MRSFGMLSVLYAATALASPIAMSDFKFATATSVHHMHHAHNKAFPLPIPTGHGTSDSSVGGDLFGSVTSSLHEHPRPTKAPSASVSRSAVPSPSPSGNGYQDSVLYNHNVHRGNHSADPLTWSSDLEASAHKLASRCVYKHDT